MSNAVVEFTDANFEAEVLNADIPVLVDVTAEWCPPCNMLGPYIERIASDYTGRAKVGKLDADENRDTLIRYAVAGLPTVIVFKNGQVVAQFRGLRSDREYREALDNA